MYKAKSLVVIPSVRNPKVISDYVKNARIYGFDTNSLFFLILIENFSDKLSYVNELKVNDLEGVVLNQKDRDKFLADKKIIKFNKLIPKRSHAETSFGLIYLALNKEFEYGFFIDDDTKPDNNYNFFEQHINNLNFTGKITEVSSNFKWVNVLYQNFSRTKLYPRGYPYSKMGEDIKLKPVKLNKKSIWVSQGLWTNIPDLDAIRILMDGDLNGQAKTILNRNDFKENFTVAKENFLTVCSMNLAFRRSVIPFFYQLPMDDNPYKIGRFDDIWSGLIAKKVLDSLDKRIISGFPLCQHNKAPRSTFKDINSEAPGYESNEYISRDLSKLNLNQDSSTSIVDNTIKIAINLRDKGSTDFIRYCGGKLLEWANLINKIYEE